MQQIKIVLRLLDKEIADKIRKDVEKLLEDQCSIHNIAYNMYEKYGYTLSVHSERDITYLNIF